jgi:hypothetical protein
VLGIDEGGAKSGTTARSQAAKPLPAGQRRTTYWLSYAYFSPGDYVRSNKALLIFQGDGNVVIYRGNGTAAWATNTNH